MAKPDWGMLQQQFLAEHAITGISPKEWCELKELNYATARRYIKISSAQNAQKTAHKKLRTAQKKESTKEPMRNSDIPTAQSNESSNAHDDENTFSLRNYGLTEQQIKFVSEYLIDLNRTGAYKRAGYKGEGNTAYVNATRMLRNAKVSRAITDALAERERRTEITQDAVLKIWWDIATADVNELTEYRRLCCRHCWGFGFNYQWRDSIEFEDATKKALTTNKPPPQDVGGYGYDETLDPNPDCPRCNGAGIGRAYFHDTRDLTGPARRVFAGVKEGKFGVEVITRNQDEALKMVAQHLGMLKNKTELTGVDGGPIKTEIANLSPQEASDAYKQIMG
ncbi:terminase small subunit [Proteus mirabilis]|uniref:terminase small subunit n=1 Tax=Proteus mirabilis TaxID=584 RepID=UPI00061CE7A2|nr:terminase small subunit [Proteus mirabilis]AWS54568.1 terminase small subunit [Proteus mirabilis]EHT2447317.1 terminase small subunit [Proteus mirabilis]ELB1228190.1 terminase small subunit [Proteus mirabilis]KKC57825.1 terminase small subunit [Proteus mirabilis]MBG2957419.1 terminase small subunit [Proteus mirabilis]